MIYEKERRYIIPFHDVPSPRAEMSEITVEERGGNFVEVETGFPEEIAAQEAKRCLSCRRCLGCALCWAECKQEAIDFSIPDEELELEFDEVIVTRGQDNAFDSIDPNLGYGNYANVITDLQFERMLSPTGPTDGMVVSPMDGEIPRRLAIVQGHLAEDEGHLLTSVILGVNEAALALDRREALDVILVSPLCQSFKEGYLLETEKVPGLRIVEGIPERVEKGSDGEPLIITYLEDGQSMQDSVDLIVVLTKQKVSSEVKSISQKLDQEVS